MGARAWGGRDVCTREEWEAGRANDVVCAARDWREGCGRRLRWTIRTAALATMSRVVQLVAGGRGVQTGCAAARLCGVGCVGVGVQAICVLWQSRTPLCAHSRDGRDVGCAQLRASERGREANRGSGCPVACACLLRSSLAAVWRPHCQLTVPPDS